MRRPLTHFFWLLSNVYGRVLGHAVFAPFHRTLLNLSLHGLGYDNCGLKGNTGEEWFVRKILAHNNIQTAFDVGANVGNYSELLTKELGCSVYAFEPNPSSYISLSKRVEHHSLIHTVHTAVSNAIGETTLYSPGENDETASLDARLVRSGTALQVPVTTLDAFCSKEQIQSVDFIKIDTEGFEREVLEGAETVLRTLQPRYIQFEFNLLHLKRGHTLLSLTELLPRYTFYRLLPHGWLPIDPGKFANNVFMYSNVVAVRTVS